MTATNYLYKYTVALHLAEQRLHQCHLLAADQKIKLIAERTEMPKKGIQVSLLLQLDDPAKVLVVDVVKDTEEVAEDFLSYGLEILRVHGVCYAVLYKDEEGMMPDLDGKMV